jgi:hypothetical protein
MRIGLAGEGMFTMLPTRMRGPDMHVVAKRVVKVIRKTLNAGTPARERGRDLSIGDALHWRRGVVTEVRVLTS